jgi:predicted TIM-barrel fold metal-dependent hydrolase
MIDKSDLFHDFRSIDYPIIDADAHVQEPLDLWTNDAPASLKERVPRVKHTDHGDFWLFDENKPPEAVAFTVSAGKSYLDYYPTGGRYDTIRPGTWQPQARLADMAIDGIYAQVLYPSVTLKGAGTYSDDRELQLYCVRRYNEWLAREFCAQGGGRLVAQAIIPTTGLADALAELDWAIAHGHKGAVISRMPSGRYEFSEEDEPFFARCCEAGIPVVIHIGSFLRSKGGGGGGKPADFRNLAFLGAAGAIKAGSHTIPVVSDLLFSGMFGKFPSLRIVLVEANIGWIPTLLEQCDDMFYRYRFFTEAAGKMGMPSEVFHQHFWATFLIDTVGMDLRHRLNTNQIMWSTDYPHTASNWPNSRQVIDRQFNGLPRAQVRQFLHSNVKELYQLHHIPDTL